NARSASPSTTGRCGRCSAGRTSSTTTERKTTERKTTEPLNLMQIEPQASAFAKRYARGEAQVVWTTLVADLETPVSAVLKIAGRPMSSLLEAVEGGAVRGRYSIIGLEPDLIWRTVEGRAEINRTPRRNGTFTPCNEPPLKALRALVAESQIALPDTLPPMAA